MYVEKHIVNLFHIELFFVIKALILDLSAIFKRLTMHDIVPKFDVHHIIWAIKSSFKL